MGEDKKTLFKLSYTDKIKAYFNYLIEMLHKSAKHYLLVNFK